MKFLILLTISFLCLSCNQEFRSSLCSQYLKNIPESFVGTYKVNISFTGSTDFETTGSIETYVYLTRLAAFSNSPTLGASKGVQTNFCEYGNDILIENRTSEGFYSYSLVKNSDEGLYISPLVLKGKTTLSLIPIPDVKTWEDNEWVDGTVFNIFSNKVVDNTSLSPSDVTPFLTTSSVNLFYERVNTKKYSHLPWKVLKKFNN